MEIYAFITRNEVLPYKFLNFGTFGFFYKKNIEEITDELIIIIEKTVETLKSDQLHRFDDINIKGSILYIYRHNKVNYYIVCTENIKKLTILGLLSRIMKISDHKERDKLINDFNEDPQKYLDQIDQIDGDLKEITEIMNKNIGEIIDRQEKIGDILERSERLTQESKEFYIHAKKLNRCCNIL